MAAPVRDLLIFALGPRRWALPLADVREVVRAVLPTPLPEAPAVVEGLIDLRGEIIPVLDLGARLGLDRPPIDPAEHFVITRAGPRTVAVRVDRVLELGARVTEPLDAEALACGAYVSGAARDGDALVLVHDLARFLAASEVEALVRALERREVGA